MKNLPTTPESAALADNSDEDPLDYAQKSQLSKEVVDRIVVLTYDTDSARSQLVLVTGRVKDGSGTPLVGASVVVKDTMRGVSAGAEGNYRIFVDPDATLVFSYIGYADREERIGTKSAIDVVLEEYEAVLEDVVVVGYGTQ